MQYSAIVIANQSDVGGRARGVLEILSKPMLEYVLDAVPEKVTEILITVASQQQAEAYANISEKYNAKILTNGDARGGSITGLLNCFSETLGEKSLVISCDTPLITLEFTQFLVDLSSKFSAVVPRWPNGRIESMPASYEAKKFVEAAQKSSDTTYESILKNMANVLYVNTAVVKNFDSKLLMFHRIRSREDLRMAETILKNRKP